MHVQREKIIKKQLTFAKEMYRTMKAHTHGLE